MKELKTVKMHLKMTLNLAAELRRNAKEIIRRNVQRRNVSEDYFGFLKMTALRTNPGPFNVICVFGALTSNTDWMNMF